MTHIELEVEHGVFIMKHADDIREIIVNSEGTFILCHTYQQKKLKGNKATIVNAMEYMPVLNDYNELRAQLTGSTIIKPQTNMKLTN